MDVLAFGEVLWDVIDGFPHIGGAPFNFAAHAARLGLKTGIVSSVGADDLGREARTLVQKFGVDDKGLFTHPTLETGTVLVTLKDGIPSYEIKRPVAWDEIAFPEGRILSEPPRAFYFGTLAQRSPVSARTLARLMDAYGESLVFFDVNLRQNFWDRATIETCLAQTDILKINDEECAVLGFRAEDLFVRHPRMKMVVETRGKDGCLVSVRGEAPFTSSAISAGPVVDTVGAGDSFSAAFVAALLRGQTPRTAAEAGNRLAGWVASRAGAIPAAD